MASRLVLSQEVAGSIPVGGAMSEPERPSTRLRVLDGDVQKIADHLGLSFDAINAVVGLADTRLAKEYDDLCRVLYHVVGSYDHWRDVPGMMPNELLDDAVRIGRQTLQEAGWWPEE